MATDDQPIIGYAPNGLPITAGPTPLTASPENQRELIAGRARHQLAKDAQKARKNLGRVSKKSRPNPAAAAPVQELSAEQQIEAARDRRESWNGFLRQHEDLVDLLSDAQFEALWVRWCDCYSGALSNAVFKAEVLCLEYDFDLVKVHESEQQKCLRDYEAKRRLARLFGGRSGTSDGF